MHPQAKMETLDEIMAMMDEAQMQRVPGREPAGVKLEKESVELDPALGEETPAELAEGNLAGEEEMGEEDLMALMAMYGEDDEEAY